MLEYRKFTKEEIESICKNIVILIDTREKRAENVVQWCDYKNRYKYEFQKLDQGDYSFKVNAIPELGITNDLYFDKKVAVEKKNSLDELSQNFTTHRARFEEELSTHKGKLVVAINDSWDNLFQGNYKSQYNRRSFIGTMMSFWHRYDVPFIFVGEEALPVFISTYFHYYLKELLKNGIKN